jgi:hypothetical protein
MLSACAGGRIGVEYALHDQLGGFSPPIFFGRLFLQTDFFEEAGAAIYGLNGLTRND